MIASLDRAAAPWAGAAARAGTGSVNRLAITAWAVGAGVRRLARQHLVEHAGQAVHVAPGIQRPLAGGLLRTHVRRASPP